jgi:hypothetical protein
VATNYTEGKFEKRMLMTRDDAPSRIENASRKSELDI